MTETPFFLRNGDYSLFAVLHEPVAEPSGEAFVFCHPLAEEKLWAHRVFVSYARHLAAAGHTVLRFDLMGNGDSDGDFSRSSVTTGLSDIRCAVDEVRRRSKPVKINLLGLRFGATLAALAAEQAEIDKLILWAPIVDGERYMQEMLRINLATQTAVYREIRHDRAQLIEMMLQGQTVNVDGYELAHSLYSEVAMITLAGDRKHHVGPCLVVHIDRQAGKPAAEAQKLASTYEHGTQEFAQEEPFWKEIATSYLHGATNLFAVTARWLSTQERPR